MYERGRSATVANTNKHGGAEEHGGGDEERHRAGDHHPPGSKKGDTFRGFRRWRIRIRRRISRKLAQKPRSERTLKHPFAQPLSLSREETSRRGFGAYTTSETSSTKLKR